MDLAESKIVTRTIWAGVSGPHELRVICTHDTHGRLKPEFFLQFQAGDGWNDMEGMSGRNLRQVLAGVYQQGALDAIAKRGSAATS